LIEKLAELYGFNTHALKLMASYLDGRTQRVCLNNKTSTLKLITSGVPQGSILGPILFSIFINDLFAVVENASIHCYADDVQIYLSNRIGLTEDLCFRLNEDLLNISTWAERNSLRLNPQKSNVLPISRHDIDVSHLPPIHIGSEQLKYVSKATNLGFVLNSNLSCVDHINQSVSKIYFTLRNLRLSAE